MRDTAYNAGTHIRMGMVLTLIDSHISANPISLNNTCTTINLVRTLLIGNAIKT